jgi:HD-GYP domain-containing protein (c-di-GMP phosphodiesterase class II)
MSLQARMMGIADIFEALTAADRPYKSGMTLSEAIAIMCRMRDNGHIDPDLFEVFVREGVHLRYGLEFLEPAQVDEVPADIVALAVRGWG